MKDGRLSSHEAFRKKRCHIWSIIKKAVAFYAVFYIAAQSFSSVDVNFIEILTQKLTGKTVLDYLFMNEPIFYAHVWFLFALLYIYLFSSIFSDRKVIKPLVFFSAVLLMLAYSAMTEFKNILTIKQSVALSSAYGIYLPNTFLFRALPFFLIGVVFGAIEETDGYKSGKMISALRKLPPLIYWILAVLFSLLGVYERFYFGVECQFYLGSYAASFLLCLACVTHPSCNAPLLQHVGRDLSVNIYVYHIACAESLSLAARYLHLLDKRIYTVCKPFAVLGLSLLVTELLYRRSKRNMLAKPE